MASIVLDPADIGVGKAGPDSTAIQVTNIVGFPDGMEFIIPFGRETTEKVHEALGSMIAQFPAVVETATMDDVEREKEATRARSAIITP